MEMTSFHSRKFFYCYKKISFYGFHANKKSTIQHEKTGKIIRYLVLLIQKGVLFLNDLIYTYA